jgi:hypothetical protein
MANLPKLPGIPSISPVQDTTIAAILRPMKESLEILGGAISGNPLPNGTTVDAGFNPAISNNLTITSGYNGATDTTPPPTPSGLTISAGFTNILLSWTDPNVSGAFLNYSYTEVWRSVDNVLSHAVLQGFAPGAVYSDPVGTSKSYYYWIRFVSQANIAGPYNSSVGTLGGTGLVGGVDLSPLIITADKIASGAIDLGGTKITGLLANAHMDVITDPTKIADSLIGNTKLADLAVDAAKLANSSVTTTKIANLAVGTAAIQTGAITNALIANAAVGSAQIADAAITSAKIGSLAVGSAAIQNAAIVNAKIADLAVDDAKISSLAVNKLTAGSVNVGQYIQSTGYSAGTNGWYIGGNGTAEFGSASIRGQLVASQIDSRGLSIKDAYGNIILAAGTNLAYSYINADPGWLNSALTPSITNAQNTANTANSNASTALSTANTANTNANSALSSVAGKLAKAGDTITGRITFAVADGMFAGTDTNNGVYFGSTGLVGRKSGVNTFYINTAGDAVFGGSLSSATGSFAGSLTAATGTFSGTLTASAVNAVDSINIAGNAVTVPANGGGYSGVSINKSGYGVWQDFSEVYVDFGSVPPTNVLIFAACNILYTGGSGSTASYMRVIETTTGNITGDNGITHTNSTLIVVQTNMAGTFTGVRHFVVQLCQLSGGPSFYASNTTISVQGTKR